MAKRQERPLRFTAIIRECEEQALILHAVVVLSDGRTVRARHLRTVERILRRAAHALRNRHRKGVLQVEGEPKT